MATVYKYPFQLQMIKRFYSEFRTSAKFFVTDERELWSREDASLTSEENEDIEILFNAEDSSARLYMDALDIMPLDETSSRIDSQGRLYRKTSPDPFVLYKGNAGYDALRVDLFKITVYCDGQWYYGTFQILPKPIGLDEWHIMKDDLEAEIRGLAEDIVRRSIGIRASDSEKFQQQDIYNFFVMRRYAKKALASLSDIAERPRNELSTEYEQVPSESGKDYTFDSVSVRRFTMRAGAEPTYTIPIKTTNYDIQDNRLIKIILLDYEKRLDRFVRLLEELEDYSENSGGMKPIQYKNEWKKSLSDFKETALRLRKMTSIIKSKKWFQEISDAVDLYVPHSFIMDSRYCLLYQMYRDLKRNSVQIDLTPEFSYTWKQSSYLYEMWCFFKVCRLLSEQFAIDQKEWGFIFSENVLFPYLREGTKIHMENEEVLLEIVFDRALPLNANGTNYQDPLYIAKHHGGIGTHNRPDILINLFDKENEWYIGSIILECKYRKLYSFWSENHDRSSRAQLEDYYNNARSQFLFDGLGKLFQIHPVKKVICLTPDKLGEGQEQQDFEIIVRTLKPSNDNRDFEPFKSSLLSEIKSFVVNSKDIGNWRSTNN